MTALASAGAIILKTFLATAAAAGANEIISKINWNDLDLGKILKIGTGIASPNDKLNVGKNNTAVQESIEKIEDNTTTPNQNQPGQEEQNKTPIVTPEIKDETNTNIETPIGSSLDNWKEYFNEYKAYNEELRKHQEEREDTAVQRWIADARKAGVNVNVLNSIGQAASDSGITSMMNNNTETLLKQMQIYSDELQQQLEQEYGMDKTKVEKIMSGFSSILSMALFAMLK